MFTRPPGDPPSPALVHAAALAIDAQRARQTQGNQAAASVIQGAHSPPSQQSIHHNKVQHRQFKGCAI